MSSSNNHPIKKLILRIVLRLLLIVAAILFLAVFLGPLLRLFLPFVLAYFAASLIAPLVQKITKKVGKVRSFWSMLFVILLIVLIVGALGGMGYYIYIQIRDLLGSWESIVTDTNNVINSISAFLTEKIHLTSGEAEDYLISMIQRLVNWLTEKISSSGMTLVSGVGNLASSIANFVVAALFFIVGTYFMTAEYPKLRAWVNGHVPHLIQPHVRQLHDAMGSAMFGYLKAQLILSGIVTLVIFLVLLLYGQQYAILIAIICGFIDLIPFFGSGTILVPWAVVQLFLGNYVKALVLLGLALALFLFRKLAEPKVVGNHTGLTPLVSLISIYVGMRLGGVPGMILVPIFCMVIISLHGVGFFDPTINDLRMLVDRIADYARLEPEVSADTPPSSAPEDDPSSPHS